MHHKRFFKIVFLRLERGERSEIKILIFNIKKSFPIDEKNISRKQLATLVQKKLMEHKGSLVIIFLSTAPKSYLQTVLGSHL